MIAAVVVIENEKVVCGNTIDGGLRAGPVRLQTWERSTKPQNLPSSERRSEANRKP